LEVVHLDTDERVFAVLDEACNSTCHSVAWFEKAKKVWDIAGDAYSDVTGKPKKFTGIGSGKTRGKRTLPFCLRLEESGGIVEGSLASHELGTGDGPLLLSLAAQATLGLVKNVRKGTCFVEDVGEHVMLYEVAGSGLRAICINDDLAAWSGARGAKPKGRAKLKSKADIDRNDEIDPSKVPYCTVCDLVPKEWCKDEGRRCTDCGNEYLWIDQGEVETRLRGKAKRKKVDDLESRSVRPHEEERLSRVEALSRENAQKAKTGVDLMANAAAEKEEHKPEPTMIDVDTHECCITLIRSREHHGFIEFDGRPAAVDCGVESSRSSKGSSNRHGRVPEGDLQALLEEEAGVDDQVEGQELYVLRC
jgi:hypothetical protein